LKARFLSYLAALALLVSLIGASAATTATAASGVTRQIALAGTGSPSSADAPSGDATFDPTLEFPGQEDEATPAAFDGTIDRSLSRGTGNGTSTQSAKKAKSNPELTAGFDGLNLFQQRYARRGNQFTVEPPDQALCVGNGYVVEAVNDVFNVYNASGQSVLPDNTSTNVVSGFPTDVNHAVDLNSFYGYAAAVNRTTGVRAQFVTDPTCVYDAATQKFFLAVLTLETFPNGRFTHVNHLDLAVSQTSNPAGTWNIYRIDVTNDGTNTGGVNPCPCLGDYPHIGADANGIYVTTNSYPWCCDGFSGAQLYAFSKAQLAAGAATVTMQHIDTSGMVNAASDAGSTQPGFTVWPAHSPGTTSFDLNAGGTEYLLSSNAADEATHPVAGTGGNYTSSQIVVWSLTNTSSLNTASPNVTLSNKILAVSQYAIPSKMKQTGSGSAPMTTAPQGYCINDTSTNWATATAHGTGCWQLLFNPPAPAHNEVISTPDSNDTRMQQVMFANGKIWGALDTAVTIGGVNRAGIAWYVVKPDVSSGSLAAKVAIQGITGMAGTDLTYPAIGVTASGRGVIAMTLSGDSTFPSAAYASIDASAGVGDIHVAADGLAPDDGFTSYKAQVGNPPRTRWGDYGAASVDGNSIWISSEYIAHACSYADWGGRFFGATTGDNKLGTCAASPGAAGTRAALGNWSTRISKITP
jgi:hypothetical protein